jgi:hypothetical protein
MKTRTLRLSGLALLAVSAFALGSPALAHDGYFHGHAFGRPHFVHPGHRFVIVRPPVFAPRPVWVVRPGPIYYAPAYYSPPAPVYYPPVAATLGGAIAGAAIGGVVGKGRPGAIAAGSVIGAAIGNGLAR